MAANRRHDYRISFVDGRVVEISNCTNPGLARLRASIYHPAGAIVKVEMLGGCACQTRKTSRAESRRTRSSRKDGLRTCPTRQDDSNGTLHGKYRPSPRSHVGSFRSRAKRFPPRKQGHRANRQSQHPATFIVCMGCRRAPTDLTSCVRKRRSRTKGLRVKRMGKPEG
jgi:hypothetical protein